MLVYHQRERELPPHTAVDTQPIGAHGLPNAPRCVRRASDVSRTDAVAGQGMVRQVPLTELKRSLYGSGIFDEVRTVTQHPPEKLAAADSPGTTGDGLR